MSQLVWGLLEDQVYEAGLDHGVLYTENSAVVWNGLTSIEDGGESDIKEYYLDGQKYLSTVAPRDWEGTLEAYTFPEEFNELIGISELADGLFADSQFHNRFGLSYRTMVSDNQENPTQHYKIHLLYNLMASLSGFSNETLNGDSLNPIPFQFKLTAVPILIPNRRPTAHLIIDTRKIDPSAFGILESILYGSSTTDPRLPTVNELIDLVQFGDTVTVVDNGDGTWTAYGSSKNIKVNTQTGKFQIDNSNAIYISEDVYEFNSLNPNPEFYVSIDEEGNPYLSTMLGGKKIFTDDDGAYYFDNGFGNPPIRRDVDDTYYVDE